MKKIVLYSVKMSIIIFLYFIIIQWSNIVFGTNNTQILEDGKYAIKSAIDEKYVLDISENSSSNGANVQIWSNAGGENQKFNVKYLGNGEYSIIASNSNKCLDVKDDLKQNGTNIIQWESSNQNNQRWIIKEVGNGYYKIISKTNGLCIDVQEAQAKNGTNIQVWADSGRNNQMFKFEKQATTNNQTANNIVGTKTIEDGKYTIKSAIDEKYVLDISENSTSNGANVQIWSNAGGENQKFNVKYLGNGEYSIIASNSNKCLDVKDNSKKNGTNIIQWASSNQDNQKWIIKEVGNGYYKIISKTNGLCIDVQEAKAKNGANVQVWADSGRNNQMFKFEKQVTTNNQTTNNIVGTRTIADGKYSIKSAINEKYVLDICDISKQNGANVQIWSNAGGENQKFNVKYLGNGEYSIIAVHSNKCLDVKDNLKKNGTNIIQWESSNQDNQKWIIKEVGNGYYKIISKTNGLCLDIQDAQAKNGTNVQVWMDSGRNNQMFKFEKQKDTNINIDTSRYPGYKERIEALIKVHPNWDFELLYTGLNFDDVTAGECKVHSRNLVPSSNSGEWVCPVCGTKLYDSGLYCASEKAVAYYMDPRNFLNENNIFQFEKLNVYESSIHTIQGIRNKVSGTFLNNYADDINTACRNKNVNPYYIVARLLQEQGTKGSKIGTGMNGGDGKTYYNPFNIGASGNGYTEIYNNALNKAKSYGWDTMEKALEGGIDFLKKNWLDNYQNTLYQNKFDIDTRNGTSLYTHQYMQHIMGAYSEAKTLKSMYSQTNCLDGYFTFIIPVYENMNGTPAPMPSNTSEASSINVKVNANGGLKLRNDANTNSDTIELIPNGTILLSVQRGINDNWNKVITSDGKIGFMSGNYLQVVDTIKNCNYTARVKTNDGSGCKVRVGPSTKLDKITTLTDWTVVTVIEKGTYNNINGYDWCRIITDDGRQGYMPLKYLN